MEAYHIDRFGSVDGIDAEGERGPAARLWFPRRFVDHLI